jgi:hypothetical protein
VYCVSYQGGGDDRRRHHHHHHDTLQQQNVASARTITKTVCSMQANK